MKLNDVPVPADATVLTSIRLRSFSLEAVQRVARIARGDDAPPFCPTPRDDGPDGPPARVVLRRR